MRNSVHVCVSTINSLNGAISLIITCCINCGHALINSRKSSVVACRLSLFKKAPQKSEIRYSIYKSDYNSKFMKKKKIEIIQLSFAKLLEKASKIESKL